MTTMSPGDAARLLSLAACFDQRTIGPEDAIAWADALEGLDPAECAEAIRFHFRESDGRLMPSHIRGYVGMLRSREVERRHAERLHAELPPVPPVLEDGHTAGYLQAVQSLRDGA